MQARSVCISTPKANRKQYNTWTPS